jgi:regulatory protein
VTIESLKVESEEGVITLRLAGGDEAEAAGGGGRDGSLSVNAAYLPPAWRNADFWRSPRALSPDEEEAVRFAALCRKAEVKALALVARAEQTRRGLALKLERRGHSPAAAREVVARFAGLGLVNDGRYGERWLRSRLARSGGKAPTPRFLLASLQKQGLDKRTAAAAVAKTLDSAAEAALLSRFLKKNGLRAEGGGSFLRNRLKHEGFSPDLIRNCVY